jgi:predicted nucleic acid-binding Zn ribbon protein
MTAEQSPGTAPLEHCPLCGTAAAPDTERCADCGYSLAGVGARVPIYTRAALLWTIAAFLAVYLVTVAIVAATS